MSSVFKSVFDRSPVGEYLLSPSEEPFILAVNDAFLRATGRTRESLVGQALFAAFPDDPQDSGDTGPGALRASLARVIATGQPDTLPLQRHPIRVTHADGTEGLEERYWHAVNTPIFDEANTLVCIAHHTEDVTEQWRMEQALQRSAAERAWSAAENARAQQALHDASHRKDEFLAMLAHELRNPLAPISAAAELLARQGLDEARLHKASKVIVRQARHMRELVDDLLDVSRVTRGLVAIVELPQEMKTLVGNAVEQARPLVEARGHHLTIDLPLSGARVRGDAKRLVQVVSNLLNNAARYTPGGGHIRVAVQLEEGTVRVLVQDDGVGIPEALQPFVFDLFSQAERTSDRTQGGLGLGLALVKSLVELHHGQVACHSAGLGHGSCFSITLPRLQDDTAAELPGAEPGHAASAGLDVLVVDDNRDAAEMLQLLLEAAGHRVRVAHEPAYALALAAAQPPDVALIDIGLPGMDGYQLVQRLRAQPATAGALYMALTGYGQALDRSTALAAGFDEHLVKPADPERLLALLEGVRRA